MAALTPFRFDRSELAGSLGDLGTLAPLAVGMIAVNGLDAGVVLITVGLFYAAIGVYYRLPIPVQPFKVIAAVSIASGLGAEFVSAGGLIMAAVLLFLGATGLISAIAKLFTKPVVRGIQLGLGLLLISKGGKFVLGDAVFLSGYMPTLPETLPVNLVLGGAGLVLTLALLQNRKLPAAIALLVLGIGASFALGAPAAAGALRVGPGLPKFSIPGLNTYWPALIMLALPQLPLTIGNAVISTRDTSRKLFGRDASARVTDRALCFSMGLANVPISLLGGMPCCHGAGGLAAHYRFGARTGGSNLIIAAVFIVLGVVFGASAMQILTLIPVSVLGVLLFFAGVELSVMIRDVNDRTQLFTTVAVAGIGLATGNLGIAFAAGIVIEQIFSIFKIDLNTKK